MQAAKLLQARDALKLLLYRSFPLKERLQRIMQFREILDDQVKTVMTIPLKEQAARYFKLRQGTEKQAKYICVPGELDLLRQIHSNINQHCRQKNYILLNKLIRTIKPYDLSKKATPSAADYLEPIIRYCEARQSASSAKKVLNPRKEVKQQLQQAITQLFYWQEPVYYERALRISITEIRQQSASAPLDLTQTPEATAPVDIFAVANPSHIAEQPMMYTQAPDIFSMPTSAAGGQAITPTPSQIDPEDLNSEQLELEINEEFQEYLDEQAAGIKTPHQSGASKLPSAAAGAAAGAAATAAIIKAKVLAGAAIALKVAAVAHPVGAAAVGACAVTAAIIKVQRKFRENKQAQKISKPPAANYKPQGGAPAHPNPFDALLAKSSFKSPSAASTNPFDEFAGEEHRSAEPSSEKNPFEDLARTAFSKM
jgi:hypothetical protein